MQFDQATGGIMPTQSDRLGRVTVVRHRIDALPADERAWVRLILHGQSRSSRGDDLSDALATEDELVEAARNMGPEKLLLMLRDKIPTDDPDLQPGGSHLGYYEMRLFVLRHASALFRPEDSAALLACGRESHDATAWWASAAACLEPGRASSILRDAFKRFRDPSASRERSILLATMWEQCGQSEMPFILNGFHRESPAGRAPDSHKAFIETTSQGPTGKDIIAAIIRDRRFENLDWESLESIARIVNGWRTTPVIAEDEMRGVEAHFPDAKSQYDERRAESTRSYPKETTAVTAHLRDWRKRLRKSVGHWDKATAEASAG